MQFLCEVVDLARQLCVEARGLFLGVDFVIGFGPRQSCEIGISEPGFQSLLYRCQESRRVGTIDDPVVVRQ
jgi:hypothetical protein